MTLAATFAFTTAVLLMIGLTALILTRGPFRRHTTTHGEASVTGACGETMSLRFSVRNGLIADTSFKSKGCAYSFSCLQSAAEAARDRTPRQALTMDVDFIARKVGPLPHDHQHCATLAVDTLHAAVTSYLQKHPNANNPVDESGLT